MTSEKRLLNIFVLSMIALIICSGAVALAADPTPPPPPPDPDDPTPVPAPPSGGNSPSWEPAAFQPYTVPVLSGDGRTIGNLTGIDYFTVRLAASVDGNDSVSLAIGGDLSSCPQSPVLDIAFGDTDGLPEGMSGVVTLASANVTGPGIAGWPTRSGTLKMTITIPAAKLAGSEDRYYLVYSNGAEYHIVQATMTRANDTAVFEAPASSLAGTFTLIAGRLHTSVPMTSPTPEPMVTPAPTPVQTPAPATTPLPVVPVIIAFGAGALIGGVAVLLLLKLL